MAKRDIEPSKPQQGGSPNRDLDPDNLGNEDIRGIASDEDDEELEDVEETDENEEDEDAM
jgi:hypothetical protein